MLQLSEVKLHLRIDHSEEDLLLCDLIATATAAVANNLNMDVSDLVAAVPAPVKSAALLLIGDLYANREAQTDRPLTSNQTYARLLAPYRAYS